MLGEVGVDKGMAAFEAARAADPKAPLFTAAELNQVGYRLLRQQKSAEAIAVFRKAVALYPATANPYDSLSEALEATGDRTGALDIARQGLEVVEREDLPTARREQLRELLSSRIKRLAR
jgi:Flp pilus assembly protein TadD